MASLIADNATKYATGPIGSNIVDQGYSKSGVRVMHDTYTFAAAAIADTLTVGEILPVGAVILRITLQNAALGAATTLSIGDAGSATRYSPAIATSAAASTLSSLNMGRKVTGTSDTRIILTLAGGVATGAIAVSIEYPL
mgnify:CR=1 FL=1